MAKVEHREKYGWWLNELESLGVSTLEKNGLNNHKEARDLTESVKQTLYEDCGIYKTKLISRTQLGLCLLPKLDLWDWIFHYALSRKLLSSNLSSSPEIRLVKDSESNVTGIDIKASTVDNIAPEDHCNKIARSIVQMLSVAAITRIDTHLTGYEAMPRTPGRLGRASKRVRIIYDIKGVPVKTNKLDLSDINTQSLMIFDKSNKLEKLNNAVSHLFDGRPADSITEAFKIIDGNAKSIRGYHKYACIRNILTHDKLYQHVKKDFTKYFPHKHSAFDFKDYVPRKNIIILDLQSPKTKLTLEKVARDLIKKVKRFLRLEES